MTVYTYSLDTTSKKFACPQCRKKTLVRYKNNQTGEYLPAGAGRCDRENNCGYHCPPKQVKFEVSSLKFPVGARRKKFSIYSLRLPVSASGKTQSSPQKLEAGEGKPETGISSLGTSNFELPTEMQFLPLSYIERSELGFVHTSFMQWLITTFGNNTAIYAAKQYLIGRSKQDGGKACIFWQIDRDCNLRTGKIMHYNAATGKRIKGSPISFVHARIPGFVKHPRQLCFFGEHLLCMHPDSDVAVVESEKTAVVCHILMPHIVWLATGGVGGCGWQQPAVYKALAGRRVTFYPDYGYANKTTGQTCYQRWQAIVAVISRTLPGSFAVSDVLERLLAGQERGDEDLVDVMVGGRGPVYKKFVYLQ